MKLGGTIFCYNGLIHDYCLGEAIESLKACCDEVVIVNAGSDDGTSLYVGSFEDAKTKVVHLSNEEWHSQKGKEKLNYFTNKAIDHLTTEYNFNLQADEILHERSYHEIRNAIAEGGEGYLCKRINLWGSPYLQLNVPQNRMPCSPVVLRLAKTKYRSYGDGESLDAPALSSYIEKIRIYHMGFVRKRDIMKKKVIHIQEEVFGVEHDKKLDGIEYFDPYRWFAKTDLRLIDEPLPSLIQKWAAERVYRDL